MSSLPLLESEPNCALSVKLVSGTIRESGPVLLGLHARFEVNLCASSFLCLWRTVLPSVLPFEVVSFASFVCAVHLLCLNALALQNFGVRAACQCVNSTLSVRNEMCEIYPLWVMPTVIFLFFVISYDVTAKGEPQIGECYSGVNAVLPT